MILGVTGGIATGKSTAVARFKQWGFPIVDADRIARKVVEPNKPGFSDLILSFGPTILTKKGTLDRKKLGNIVFKDPKKRAVLNTILSSYIKEAILQEIEVSKKNSSLVIVDIPLLFEENYEKYVDQVAVVYTSETTQLSRVMKRDNLCKKEALNRMDSQWPIEKKRKLADIVFNNEGKQEFLENSIDKWLYKNNFVKNQ